MSYKIKIDDFFEGFNRRMEGVPEIIAETATEYFKERLIEKEWDGVAYAPYANPKREPTRGSLMMRTNNLFSTIRPSMVSAGKVTITGGSAKVRYARIHNEGGRVRAVQNVRAFTNNNFMGRGQRVQIQTHTRRLDYTMPRRQFMGVSDRLNTKIRQRITLLFQK